MGMSYSVYVGPFIRVPTFNKDVTVTRYECSGCGNKKVDKSTAFCPKCGKAVLAIPEVKSELKVPRPYDLSDEFSETMFIAESGYSMAKAAGFIDWIPNLRGFGTTFSSDRDSTALVVADSDRQTSLAKFIAQYQPLVDAAQALYGVQVQVLYGVVPYSH